MSSEDAPSVFPAYVDAGRFAIVDGQHQSGPTYILTIICVVYSGLVLVIRAHLRWGIYGIDDYLAAAATIAQGIEAGTIIVALNHGTGTAFELLSNEQRTDASEWTLAGTNLFLLSTGLAKISVTFLMMRLFNLTGARRSHDRKSGIYRTICFGNAALIGAWTIGSIIGMSVDCNSKHFLDAELSRSTCPAQLTRWTVIMAFDVLTELILVVLASIIVVPLHLAWDMKVPVILAFATRIPCAVLSSIHFHYIVDNTNNNRQGLGIVPVLNMMQIQLCWSLVSATIPNLKGFVKSFNTGFGLGFDLEPANGSYGYRRTDYELSRLGKSVGRSQQRSRIEPERDEVSDGQLVAHGFSRPKTRSMHEHEGSINSVGSQEQIIRKDVQWTVRYEEAGTQ